MEIALQTGDAFLYISCQYFKAWALLFLGEWGEALRLTRDGIRLAEKNGHITGETVLRLIEAKMRCEAEDFAGARATAVETLAQAPPGAPQFLSRLLLSEAQAGLSEYEAAMAGFEEILQDCREGLFRLDWIFQMPLYRSLAEVALARGDLATARPAAAHLCSLAALSGERTFHALARNVLCRIALMENHLEEAATQSAQAVLLLAEAQAPLAEWRVCQTAARLALRRGRRAEADSWFIRSETTVGPIADTMNANEPLRAALLAVRDRQVRPRLKTAETS